MRDSADRAAFSVRSVTFCVLESTPRIAISAKTGTAAMTRMLSGMGQLCHAKKTRSAPALPALEVWRGWPGATLNRAIRRGLAGRWLARCGGIGEGQALEQGAPMLSPLAISRFPCSAEEGGAPDGGGGDVGAGAGEEDDRVEDIAAVQAIWLTRRRMSGAGSRTGGAKRNPCDPQEHEEIGERVKRRLVEELLRKCRR